ncbi:MAG: hypothetical protein JNK02_08920 [Planctomycetes bacterium]|nr:hypothetical protein [Planctomycetota bacterium]
MAVLGRMLLGLLTVVGWIVLALALVLGIAEETGLVARLVREVAARELGALGDELRLEGVRFLWFDRAFEIDRALLGRDGELAHLRGVHVELGAAGEDGPPVRRIEVASGRVRLAPALLNGLVRYRERMEGQAPRTPQDLRLPTIQVEALDLELVSRRAGVLPLGRLDLLARTNARGAPEIFGRLVPALQARAPEPGGIFVSGTLGSDGVLALRANAARLPLGVEGLPPDEALELVRALEPAGLLELEVAARLPIDGGAPAADVRLAVQRGALRLDGDRHRFESVRLDVEARWLPPEVGAWRELSTWHGLARATGTWNGAAFEGTALFGDEAGLDHELEAWARLPDLRIAREILEAFGAGKLAYTIWEGLDPRGSTEVSVAAHVPRRRAGAGLVESTSVLALARPAGGLSITYQGMSRDASGAFDEGFPIPLERVTGEIAFVRDPERRHPWTIALLDLAGSAGAGAIRAHGIVQAPPVDVDPRLPTAQYVEIDLDLASDRLIVDDRLRAALAGLSGPLPPDSTWRPFRPEGGEIGVKLRLFREARLSWLATDLELALRGVSLAWDDLPVPVQRAEGRLVFRSDGVTERALAVTLEGALRTAPRTRVALRSRTIGGERASPDAALDEVSYAGVEVERVSLSGDDRRILVERVAGIGGALEELSPRGFADIRYERVRHDPARAVEMRAEVVPLAPAQIVPKRFPLAGADVRGRALYTGRELGGELEADVRLAPLLASLPDGSLVALGASLPDGPITILAAGVDPANKALTGAVGGLLSAPGVDGGPARPVFDGSALTFAGRLDVAAELPLGASAVRAPDDAPDAAQADAPGADGAWRFYLRGSTLATSTGFRLDEVRGELSLADGVLGGVGLAARLAGTAVDLDDVRFARGAQGWRLETGFGARGVPVDRAHLGGFFDAATLDALLDEFRWQGRFDFDDGRLSITIPPRGGTRLELSGAIVPAGMSIAIGLPLEVAAATARLDRLVREDGKVRALATIEGLEGALGGRRLADTRMVLTYVEPALSIETITGELEGGTLRPLGAGAERAGTPFNIALEKPFPFQLALDLDEVEVEGLLRGLFPSGIATSGKVDAQLRLSGDLERLLGIQGTGSVRLKESRLWSVPVFRALFGQLGLDDTATFDSMYANLRVRDGVVEMDDILLRSPLLQLVGSGTLDFDGRLSHDLEVRYALVDNLGPLTRILYWIQNELLSVEIRGDMGRPIVVLQNPLRRIFGARRDHRALPAPGYAPLPERF